MPNQGQMMILRCRDCGTLHTPPKYLCTKCEKESLEEFPSPGLGRINTFTTIYVAPEKFKKQAPYDIAIIELDEGLRVTGRVKRMKNSLLNVGDPVLFTKKDHIGYWFKLGKDDFAFQNNRSKKVI